MATRGNTVELVFAGDDQQLQKTFRDVGSGADKMAGDVGSASRKMADSTGKASADIAGAVDSSEGKFRGLGDVIGGTGDVMDGFREGNIAQMAMGMADIAGGISSLVIPALTAMKTAILTGLTPALTAISAHPLIAGLLIGGAIIAGLILLEKKFGVVTTAVGFVKDALSDVWDWISGNWPLLANILTTPFLGAFRLISMAWNATLGGFRFGFSVPDWIPVVGGNSWDFKLPKMPTFTFHTGGVVPGFAGQNVPAILQAGETVVPRGQSAGMTVVVNVSGVGMGRDFGDAVARALRDNRLIGVTI